jgi:hypothetical protein
MSEGTLTNAFLLQERTFYIVPSLPRHTAVHSTKPHKKEREKF